MIGRAPCGQESTERPGGREVTRLALNSLDDDERPEEYRTIRNTLSC